MDNSPNNQNSTEPDSKLEPKLPPNSNGLGTPLTTSDAMRSESRSFMKKILWIIFATVLVVLILWLTGMILKSKPQATENVDLSDNSKSNSAPKYSIDTSSLDTTYTDLEKSGIKEFSSSQKDKVIDQFSKLTEDFNVDDEFIKDPVNSLLAIGISYLATKDPENFNSYRNEMYLLVRGHTASLPAGISDSKFEKSSKEADQKAINVINKFKDADLTEQLKKSLYTSGILDKVASNLNMGNTDPLKVPVVIAMKFEANDNTEFTKEHYMYGKSPTMWVEVLDGNTYIMVTKDYAEDFLSNPDSSSRFKIMHELVHTQGSLVRGELGRSLEEPRAEHFSDMHSSYYDAKQLLIYTNVFSGIDIYSLMDASPTDASEFYINLYKTFGVKTANMLVNSWPNEILDSSNPIYGDSQKAISSYDMIIQSAIKLGESDLTAVNNRKTERAAKLIEVFGSKQKALDDLTTNVGNAYHMPTAAKAMSDFINLNY